MLSTEMEKRLKEEKPEKVKAVINVFNGGKYGKNGQYVAIIKPEYFGNGNIKHQSFTVVEELETLKRGYSYGSARQRESIGEILEIC